MLVKTATIITQRTMFASQKSVKLVDVIRMLIGLTGIFANHIKQKVRCMMQLVIDISEDDYKKVQDGRASVSMMRKAIRNGTPLPKGHGELVDIRPLMRGLYEEICVGELTYTTSEVYKMLENEAPTIIEAEADTESEEKEMSKAEYDKIIHLVLQDINTGRLDRKYESAIAPEDVIAFLQRIYKGENEK